MTQSDNKTTDSTDIQTYCDKRDIETVKQEIGEEIGRVQEQAKNQISITERLIITRDYCDRFTYDELMELTGAGESTVHTKIKIWLATDKVVEVGQKKWDKSVYSTRPMDIVDYGLAGEGGDSQNEGDS